MSEDLARFAHQQAVAAHSMIRDFAEVLQVWADDDEGRRFEGKAVSQTPDAVDCES